MKMLKRYHPLQAIILSSRNFPPVAATTFAFVVGSNNRRYGRTTTVIPPSPSLRSLDNGGTQRISIGQFHSGGLRRNNIMSSSASSTEEGGGGGAVAKKEKSLVVDPFCFRQFSEKETSKGYAGTVFNVPIEKFEDIVNSRYDDPSQLRDGYAPFCKHLFLVNDFTDARGVVLPITKENEHCLRTRYEARNERELPVLARYFDRELLLEGGKEENDVFPVAKYLDLILYSREQIEKENAAMGKNDGEEKEKENAPWGIVSIKAQDVDHEHPMTPITAMRNALGKDQGGSGVELDKEAYMDAVEYWRDHANVL